MSKTFHKRGSLRLAGYLIDGHGDPISDAHVVLDGLSYTLSDHSGLFVFDGLASDSYCLDAYSQTHHLPPVLICVRERVEPIRLRMFAAGRLRVRVTDGNVPIEGAQLMRRAELAAVTDENGSACITGLGGSLELFYVHAKGYASTTIAVTLGQEAERATEVPMSRGSLLGGVALEPDDRPAVDTVIKVWSDSWGGESRTDSDGRWLLENVAPGAYQLRASSRRFMDTRIAFDIEAGAPSMEVIVRMRRGGTVIGTVISSDGLPINQPFVVASATREPSARFQTRGDDQGHYEISGLEPGSYRLFAYANDLASQEHLVVIEHGGPVTASLRVEPAAIVGVVVDASGAPVCGASVTLHHVVARGDVTDPSGSFEMRGVPPGRYEVSVQPPDRKSATTLTGVPITTGVRALVVIEGTNSP